MCKQRVFIIFAHLLLFFFSTSHCFVSTENFWQRGQGQNTSPTTKNPTTIPQQTASSSRILYTHHHWPFRVIDVLSSTSTDNEQDMIHPNPLVKNFRPVTGCQNIYRCASTDFLCEIFQDDNDADDDNNNSIVNDNTATKCLELMNNDSPENMLLNNVGLILDLRSDSERDEIKIRKWMSLAPGGAFQTKVFERNQKVKTLFATTQQRQRQRIVYRIDVLSPTRLFDYMSKQWISTPTQKLQYMMSTIFDSNSLHKMRMDVLNERGLEGLYEAIIETSQDELLASLKAIVKYLESTESMEQECTGKGVAIHCVQGKDRTGIVAMLCQSMMGISDDIIVSEYNLSEKLLNRNEGSAALSSAVKNSTGTKKGKLSREIFSGSPAKAMISTLKLIRTKYGSIHRYLDSIGFDDSWRRRFVKVSQHTNNMDDVDISQSRL